MLGKLNDHMNVYILHRKEVYLKEIDARPEQLPHRFRVFHGYFSQVYPCKKTSAAKLY